MEHEGIAVIGMACRFPGGADSPKEFWEMLINKRDALTDTPDYPIPAKNKKHMSPLRGGAVKSDCFDAEFFGISEREAKQMDPQHRIFMEVSWEAIEDAGCSKESLAKSRTGVFVGAVNYNGDYARELFERESGLNVYSGTGTAHSVLVGRLSNFLDLRGPNIAVDTACSSSLVAIHLASQSLRLKETTLAIAGGVNLILSPAYTSAVEKMQLLSEEGRCKPFDESADGIVRSDGCGILVLKLLSDAIENGDRILAVIRGSAVNHDGRTNGITMPNASAQVMVIKDALANSGLSPADIQFIETHGTGTVVGDPLEIRALSDVLRASPRTRPCSIGSVKANIGHSEASSGVAGIIKAILALRHKAIPPQIHLHKLNPFIRLDKDLLHIPTEVEAWPTEENKIKRAGVSSFSWSGTNAHVIVEEAPEAVSHGSSKHSRNSYELLPISAAHPEGLQKLALSYLDIFQHTQEEQGHGLREICYTASLHRTHHAYRVAFVGQSFRELEREIGTWLASEGHVLSHNTASCTMIKKEEDGDTIDTILHKQRELLEKTAGEYIENGQIDWAGIYKEKHNIVSLPRYPWQSKRYWM